MQCEGRQVAVWCVPHTEGAHAWEGTVTEDGAGGRRWEALGGFQKTTSASELCLGKATMAEAIGMEWRTK